MKNKINISSVLIFIAAVMWGGAGIFVRTANKIGVSEMQMVLLRAVFSVLILAFVILFKNVNLFKIKLRHIPIFVGSGVFSIVLFNFCYYKTMALTGSLSIAAVLLYTAPFFVMLISAFLFKEKITVKKVISLLVAFVGCCLVTGVFSNSGKISSAALFFGVMTGFGYAMYTIFGRLLLNKGYNSLTITFYTFVFAFFGSLPFVNLKETTVLLASKPQTIVLAVLMGMLNTVIPYMLYTSGLKGVEPSTAPIIAMAEPVVATLIGWLIYGDKLTIPMIIGIAAVIFAVVILNLGERNMNKINIIANAKINLNLAITGIREDGYHTIDTVMQSIALGDKLTVEKADKISVKCSNADFDGDNNIAYRAAVLFFEKTKISGGAHITIEKQIPAAAGLGGGSADAAAVICALNKLYNCRLKEDELCKIAVELGADVPFFVIGGTVRARGIGEELTKLLPVSDYFVLLGNQGEKPSTAQMYKQLDSENYPVPNIEEQISSMQSGDFSTLENSFSVLWETQVKEKIQSFGADGVSLSGSGPFWFGIFKNESNAINAFNGLKSQNIKCYLTKPCDFSLIFE